MHDMMTIEVAKSTTTLSLLSDVYVENDVEMNLSLNVKLLTHDVVKIGEEKYQQNIEHLFYANFYSKV